MPEEQNIFSPVQSERVSQLIEGQIKEAIIKRHYLAGDKLPSEREHVTPYMYNNKDKFKIFNLENSKNFSFIRITIDRENDLELIRKIVSKIPSRPILLSNIIELYNNEPKIFELNQDYDVNEGYLKSLENDKNYLRSKK